MLLRVSAGWVLILIVRYMHRITRTKVRSGPFGVNEKTKTLATVKKVVQTRLNNKKAAKLKLGRQMRKLTS